MFAKRLKELRAEKEISQADLAKIINSSNSKVSMWEVGKRDPNSEDLITLSKYFNVSIDYLLGTSNIKNPYNDKVVNMKEETEEDPLAGYKIAAHKEGDEDFTLEQKRAIANLIEETLKKIEKGKK